LGLALSSPPQADNNVAALNHYSTTTELALPRMMSAQVMAIGENGYISGNWADWSILPGLSVVYDALYSGDLTFASSQYDKLLANHTYAWGVRSNDLVHVDGLGALVDTSGGDDDGFQDSEFNSVVNAWSYLAMRRVAQLGRWIGRSSEAAQLDATADALRAAFKSLLVNGSSAVAAVCDGLCSTTPHQSVHSTFYALYAGLFADDGALTTSVAAYVRARAVEDPMKGIPCGSYPVQFLLAGLYADGADHGNAAFGVLTAQTLHSYRHMMEFYGATATMECWSPEELGNLSFSHVWSSSPAIIIPQFFFGLVPTSPGFATFDVKPQPGPVLQGSATMPTVRGPVSVAFTQTQPSGGCFDLSLVVPGGSVARAFVPRYGATVSVKVDGVVVSATVEGDYAWVSVPAGAHSVTSC
jgi:alpha-L-rhamnosidase